MDVVAAPDSPFRRAAETFAEALRYLDGKLCSPNEVAAAIADVVESADAPFRSVVPEIAGQQARFAEFVSDTDFRTLYLSTDYRSFSRAQRHALANAAERARQA